MKSTRRLVYSFIIFSVLIFSSVICANAAADKIQVIAPDNSVVKTFDIDKNSPDVNARTAIQNALNYVKNNSGTAVYTVRLPIGNYYIYSSLDVYSNTTLDLSGSTLFRMGKCGAVIRFGRGTDVSYGYGGYKNITVKNGTIDANKTGSYSLVRFAHAENITFSSVTMKNSKDVLHLLTFAACNNVKILNCTFSDMEISGAKDKYNCEAVQIDILKTNHFSYPADDGTPTKNVTVSGCTFSNVQRGLGTHSAVAGHYFENMVFESNTFKNVKGYAVSAVNYRNSKITKNKIISCGSGIMCGNVTGSNFAHFYAPFKSSDTVKPNAGLIISDNTISVKSNGDENTAYGIDIRGAQTKGRKDSDAVTFSGDFRITDVRIENNRITVTADHNSAYGIRLSGAYGSEYGSGSNFVVKGNVVIFSNTQKLKNINDGIKLDDCSKIYIVSNSIYDKKKTSMNLRNGIIAEKCRYIYLKSNKITNSKSYAVKLTNVSAAKLSSNELRNNLQKSINICSGCKKINIVSNRIYSFGDYAIYITSDAACTSVSSNYICGGKGMGIYLNKSAVVTEITKNKIDMTSGSNAVTVNGSASCKTIDKNRINLKENKNSKKLKVKCNNGIVINSDACAVKSVSSNRISNCTQYGVYINKSKTKPKIEKNKFSSCKKEIYCSSAKAKTKTK